MTDTTPPTIPLATDTSPPDNPATRAWLVYREEKLAAMLAELLAAGHEDVAKLLEGTAQVAFAQGWLSAARADRAQIAPLVERISRVEAMLAGEGTNPPLSAAERALQQLRVALRVLGIEYQRQWDGTLLTWGVAIVHPHSPSRELPSGTVHHVMIISVSSDAPKGKEYWVVYGGFGNASIGGQGLRGVVAAAAQYVENPP